jgi:pyruvate/2-oxoglutarate dehydrogenase complex dihydrolipoamide acyltransferase (E2) component
VGNLGQTVGQVGEGAGEAVGGVAQGAGQAAGGVGEAAGGALGGVTDAAGGLLGGAGGNGNGDASTNGGGIADVTAPKLAKEAVKVAAKQLGSVASDEAKDLTLSATRKVMELGDRRREKRADKHNATAAAMRAAEDAGVSVEEIDGSGKDGRVTLRDVQEALKS